MGMVACGGGGGGGGGGGTSESGGSTGISNGSGTSTGTGQGDAPITVGDSYTTSVTDADVNTGLALHSPNFYITDLVSKVNADGSYISDRLWNNGYLRVHGLMTSDDQPSIEKHVDYSCETQPPVIGPTRNLTLGMNWNVAYTITCRYDSTGQILSHTNATNVGSVTSLDSITTSAGTFNAYKLVQVRTFKDASGTTVQRETCWREPKLRRDVACDKIITNSGSSSSLATRWRLEAYSSVATNARVQIPATYSGNWQLSLSTNAKVKCGSIKVSITGDITGACVNAIDYPYGSGIPVTGKVAANGTVTAAIGNVIRVTGSLGTPGEGSGQWGDGTLTGAWDASHQ